MDVTNNIQINKSLSHYFIKGEATKRFYDTIAMAAGLCSSFFIIRSLSVFHYGLYQLLLSFVSIVTSLGFDFIDNAVTVEMRVYFSGKKSGFAKRIFHENIVLKTIFTVLATSVIFFGSAIIAKYYGEDVALFIKIMSILVIIDAFQTIEGIFFKSIISFAHWSFPALKELFKLGVIVLFVFFGKLTLLSIISIHVASELVSLILVTFIVFLKNYRKAFCLVESHSGYLMPQIIRLYGLWGSLRFMAAKISKNTMPWFIKFFINTEAVGYYSMALNLVAFVGNLMPSAGFGPVFLLRANNTKNLGFVFKRSVKYIFWLGMFFCLVGLVFVPHIIHFLFPNYMPAMRVFEIMLIAMPFYGVYDNLKAVLSVLREYKILTTRILSEMLIVPISSILFLPVFGVLGSGITYVVTYLWRILIFYSQLIKKHPEFKIKPVMLFKFGNEDKKLILSVANNIFASLKSFVGKTKIV